MQILNIKLFIVKNNIKSFKISAFLCLKEEIQIQSRKINFFSADFPHLDEI